MDLFVKQKQTHWLTEQIFGYMGSAGRKAS